jgi:hypothetical protein
VITEKFPQSVGFFLKNFLCMSCTRFFYFFWGQLLAKMCPQKENAKFVNFIKASVVFALGFCCGLGLTNLACFLWHLDRCGGGEEG